MKIPALAVLELVIIIFKVTAHHSVSYYRGKVLVKGQNELYWHYAFGYWKEYDLPSYDSSCDINQIVSSHGAFGFTPWIDFGRRYWGIIAFEKFNPPDCIPGAKSVKLEQQIQETIDGILGLQ